MTDDSAQSDCFYIIAIDGGGIRGAFPAQLLANLEKLLNRPLSQAIQLFSGTSTGAIIAAAAAAGLDMSQVAQLYKSIGPEIFAQNGINRFVDIISGGCRSLYSSTRLKAFLHDALGNFRLKDLPSKLILTACELNTSRFAPFRAGFDTSERENIPVEDAVLASCSAPVFFAPTEVKDQLLGDGSLWANNPALLAACDAHKLLNIAWPKLRVLSLGVGYPASNTVNTFKGWLNPASVDTILALQSASTDYYLQTLLEPHQYLRLDFAAQRLLPIDDCSSVGYLQEQAELCFSDNRTRIEEFFNVN